MHFQTRMSMWGGWRILALAALAAGACSDEPAGPVAGTNFYPLFTTQYSNIKAASRIIVQDPQSWQQLWETIGASNSETRAAPKIDFSDSEVVAVALGERKRAGFQIAIEQVVFTDSSRNVLLLITVPGEQCTAPEVITTPLDAAVVSKTTKPTRFIERLRTGNCG